MQASKFKSIFIGCLILLTLHSCSKEKCAQCYTEETSNITQEIITTPIGELCGEELENADGKTFTSAIGPARTYCE